MTRGNFPEVVRGGYEYNQPRVIFKWHDAYLCRRAAPKRGAERKTNGTDWFPAARRRKVAAARLAAPRAQGLSQEAGNARAR